MPAKPAGPPTWVARPRRGLASILRQAIHWVGRKQQQLDFLSGSCQLSESSNSRCPGQIAGSRPDRSALAENH
jgi:hypothetical protein